ncbi:MAG TPA: class I SAM-dependent methyltransferase [Turneriella sp.]|nr:class I SAM-dependent methyltransferase [Turneriella sp.]
MKDNNARRKRGFNFIAPFYDFLASFFFVGKLFKAQTYFIPQLKKARRALVLGGGTGKILTTLLKNNTAEEYHYIDIAEAMVERAQKRTRTFAHTHCIRFTCAALENAPLEKYDLIVTPFILDCFDDVSLEKILPRLSTALSKNGEWLFVDFNIPTGKRRVLAHAIVKFLYFCFNLLCALDVKKLPLFEKLFAQVGFQRIHEKYFLYKLVAARVYHKT